MIELYSLSINCFINIICITTMSFIYNVKYNMCTLHVLLIEEESKTQSYNIGNEFGKRSTPCPAI